MNQQQRAVVHQALEALETALKVMESDWLQIDSEWGPSEGGLEAAIDGSITGYEYFQTTAKSITALRQLLEQPEPVQDTEAFLHWYDNAHWGNEDFKEGCHRSWNAAIEYTTPPAQPAAWVGLTEEDIVSAKFESYDFALNNGSAANTYVIEFARAIEQRLKEKNT
jgi:hypothetical protein